MLSTILGFTYKVESNTVKQLKVKNYYHYPNGKSATTEHTIETNALFACLLTIPTVQNDMLGNFKFVVSFPENPEIESLEQTFYVFDQTKGLLFYNKPFTPATEQNIKAFEHKHSTLLCEDYKQFLKTYNGLFLHWWHYSDEFDKNKGAYPSTKHGILQTHYPFHEDLGKRYDNWDWIYDTRTLFGIGNNNPYLDIKDVDTKNLFYHNNLMQYAYPIGQDPGGNCLMQIAQGKHRGKLAMLDHEISGPMIDWIEGVTTDEVYKTPPQKATTDEFLADCFEYGGLTLYEFRFDAFFTEIIRKHEDLYAKMKEAYGK